MTDLLSLKTMPLEKIQKIFDIVNEETFSKLDDKILGFAFFQSSTRTKLSFESAMLKLGGKAIGFSDMQNSRCFDNYFQETLDDFVRVVAQIVDVLVIRHPTSFIHFELAKLINIPLINAGDGTNEHPTQALQDIWLMQKKCGSLDGKVIAFAGDISRNYRSMIFGLTFFNIKKLIFLLPFTKILPEDIKIFLDQKKIIYEFYTQLADVLKDADFIHTFTFSLNDLEQHSKYIAILNEFVINRQIYNATSSQAYIFNAGPRTYEVDKDMDNHPKFLFFEQVKTGVHVRKGILSFLLGEEHIIPVERKICEISL